jgi:hypothetical protein
MAETSPHMSTALNKSWIAARLTFCVLVALLNAEAIGFQGNGNLLLTGVFIGLLLGAAWSALLSFGLPALARQFHLSMPSLLATILVAAVIVLPIISIHLWGHSVQFTPWPNKYWP